MDKASIVVRFMDKETEKEIMSIKTDQIPHIPSGMKITIRQKVLGRNWDAQDLHQTRNVNRTEIIVSKTYPDSNHIFEVREMVDVFVYLNKPKE